jgi:rubrerythrin
MSRRFIRTIEDFICEQCGTPVHGNGYTNHCPACLYSKHVDINPGDRASPCGGLMEPIAVEMKKGQPVIVHRCLKCGAIRRNRAAKNDSMERILAIMGGFVK